MISKWFQYKEEVIKWRKTGHSIGFIEKKFGIPRSTLSGWFKSVTLSNHHKKILKNKWKKGLIKARREAVVWHNSQKELRLEIAKKQAQEILNRFSRKDLFAIELVLSALYLGEGFKKAVATGMGNSDPLILKFFVTVLKNIYKISVDNMRCELHIRADQNANILKKYWSQVLDIPISRFLNVSVDVRTKGKPSYPDYKGVCIVNCGNVAIQRKLVYLGRGFLEESIKSMRG